MQTEGLVGGPNPTGMGLREGGGPQSRVGVAELLEQVLTLGASDLHLTAGAKPTVRVNGRLGQLEDYPVLQPAETQAMIYSILTQRQRERLEGEQELDCAHALPGKARFRLNVYFQRDSVGAAFRLIPQEIKPLEALGIPPQVPPQPQALPGQPARGRRGHQVVRQRPQARPAPGPRHHPGRRAARPRDDLDRPDRGRDRPPGVRHPPHPGRAPDGRPGDRRVPGPTSSSRSGCSWPAPSRAWSASSWSRPPTGTGGSWGSRS
jgi:hypothetical protein